MNDGSSVLRKNDSGSDVLNRMPLDRRPVPQRKSFDPRTKAFGRSVLNRSGTDGILIVSTFTDVDVEAANRILKSPIIHKH